MKTLIELKNAAKEALDASKKAATAFIHADRTATSAYQLAQHANKRFESAEADVVDAAAVAAAADTAYQSAWDTYNAAFQIETDAIYDSILTASPLELQS